MDLPSGLTVNQRIVGPEVDQFFVSDALLSPGTYTWRVQAACSTLPPYSPTLISASNSFTKGVTGSCPAATVTDIDGNVYNTVLIGSQCWTAENLKVERYRNGDNIPTGLSNSAWETTTNGAFAVYDNVAANKATYGLLYNWFAAVDPRGLCPTGWHVPTDADWTQLTDHLGGEGVAGGEMKATGILEAGTGLWLSPNFAATNNSGFSGLPGGFRYDFGFFDERGFNGYWWSSSENSASDAWYRVLNYFLRGAGRASTIKPYGFSVRCLLD